MRWDPTLAVGHAEIDAQHQELFDRVGLLLRAMGSGGDAGEIGALFDFLGTYVVEHFAAEERLMSESRYPGATVHRAAHQRFIRDYETLRRQYADPAARAALALRTRTWLAEWLRSHIAGTDQQLARHLMKRSA